MGINLAISLIVLFLSISIEGEEFPNTRPLKYQIFEYNLIHTFNYAEMAALIAPIPFIVEREHKDVVAPDKWVAYEYAKVRRLYIALDIPEKNEIEFFQGPHTINSKGTFNFLHRHLKWPNK